MSRPTANTDSPDLSGATLCGGRIELLQRLGAGAFGAVYRAQEYALGKPLRMVAVKLTHRTNLSDSESQAVLQEGFTLASLAAQCRDPLARPHLIQVFSLGVADDLDGRGYVILEFVSGVLLLKHIAAFGASIPPTTVRRYFLQMCRAIQACHTHDPPIMHGDLKPDNILVDLGQTIRIVDFGLSAPLDRLAGFAVNPGVCLSYCAPESIVGRGLPQSDMYSLGLVMYELFAGDGPHCHLLPPEGTHHSYYYYQQKHKMQFPPLSQQYRGLNPDPALFQIVERCLQFHPEDRFGSIQEIIDELGEPAARKEAPAAGVPVSTTLSPEPAATLRAWQEHAERCASVGDYADGREVVAPYVSTDRLAAAYDALFLVKQEPAEAVVKRGFKVLNTSGAPLPINLQRKLVQALWETAVAAAKTNPGMKQYEIYLQDQLEILR